MTQQLPPGWYPDPKGGPQQLYWDGRAWNAAPASPPRTRKRHPIVLYVIVFGALVWLMQQCSNPSSDRSSTSSKSSSSSSPSTTEAPAAWKYMAGDGTHQMGGVDGKNWGVWVSGGGTPPGNCTWSIRSVSRYRPGEVLDEGEAPAYQRVTVDIEPDGDVHSYDGTIGADNHRLVFMTNNCGAWRPK